MLSKQTPRRRHSAEFKAKVVAACGEPGASVAAVALAHELNANLVHKWRRGRGLRLTPVAGVAGAKVPEFVALSLPSSAPTPAQPPAPRPEAQHIRIAIDRSGGRVEVSWPLAGAAQCAAWLRELLR
jgi:transposase